MKPAFPGAEAHIHFGLVSARPKGAAAKPLARRSIEAGEVEQGRGLWRDFRMGGYSLRMQGIARAEYHDARIQPVNRHHSLIKKSVARSPSADAGPLLHAKRTIDKCYGVVQHVIMRHVVEEVPRNAKPLSEPVVLILASLAQQPRHGYALLADVEKLSEGRVRLSTGTLYGAIRRLLEDGWIKRFQQEDTSRDKQAYSLTKAGRGALESEINRLRNLVQLTTTQLSQKGL